MGEGIDADWPDEDEPSADAEEAHHDTPSEANQEDENVAIAEDEAAVDEEKTEPAPWTLPIRAAPILALQDEVVTEFPLSQHLNGLESTSLVVDEHLMRIVESRFDPDGVRRLNVRMALVKEHISGYSHTHLDLFAKLQPLWWAAIAFGTVVSLGFAQSVLAISGAPFILAGVAGWLVAKLDLHRLSFSDHGGRHDFYLSGWRQEPYLIHNSTALLGPAFVDFLRNGEIETQHINNVVESMGKPPEPAPVPSLPPTTVEPEAPLLLPPTAMEMAGPPVMQSEPEPPLEPMQVTQTPPLAQTSPELLPPPVPEATPPGPPPPIHAPAPPISHAPSPPMAMPAPLPPAPLPPLELPPAPAVHVDEDALWDDLK
ncbi:MAG: hypothetical protein QF531_00840 [Candidatus Poseidonia sp.]|nr:hypothetical protein [Poseidonia sp.]